MSRKLMLMMLIAVWFTSIGYATNWSEISVHFTNEKNVLGDFVSGVLIEPSYSKLTEDRAVTAIAEELAVENEKRIVKGTVVDEDGQPIAGASVVIYPRVLGVVTDQKGEFNIMIVPGDSIMEISFIGMETQKIYLARVKKSYDIMLVSSDFMLNEVVVTGYGELDKRNFTGTSTKVTGEELIKVSPNNIIQSLSVLDPSFRLVDNNVQGSDPNALPEFYIRGRTGIGNQELTSSESLSESELRNNPNLPTFILDGYEVGVEVIYDLDPSLVKSVDILKDASSTAIYGSRAANGVVVIETRQPKSGKLRINYSMTGSVSAPDLSVYDLTDASEKLELERLAGMYISNSPLPDQQMKAEEIYYQKLGNINKGVNTYWLAQPVETSFSNKHIVNISGGDNKMLYGIDLVSDFTKGVMKESLRRRNSIGVTLSYRLKKIQFKNKIEWQNVKSEDSPYGNFAIYSTRNPYDSFLDEAGKYKQVLSEDWNVGKHYNHNPLYDAMLLSYSEMKMNAVSNNFTMKWFVIDNLYFQTKVAFRYSHSDDNVFKDPASSSFTGKAINEKGTLSIRNRSEFSWDANAVLNYSKSFGKNHVSSSLGTNMREVEKETSAFAYQGFPTGTLNDLIFAAKLLRDPTGGKDNTRLVGFFGMLNYTHDNIYLFDVSGRFDGASQFGDNNQFAPFWSLGAGINVHNYGLIKENMPWLDNLKARATYGILGNAGFNQNLSQMIYTYPKSQWYIDGIGATINVLGNPDLKWERSTNIDLGLDIGLFKRFFMSLGYYEKTTNNLIGSITIPASTGFTSYKSNLGKVLNEGYEIMTRIAVVKGRNLNVNIHGSAAHNSNRIEEISDALKDYNQKVEDFYNNPSNASFYSPLLRYYPGASLTSIYAMESRGINPADGREVFVNKDGTLTYDWDASQHVVVGDTEPDVSGAFGFNIDYKGIFLYTAFNYAYGGQLMNSTLYSKVENANIYGNVDRRVFTERWKNPGDVASYKAIRSWQETTRATSRFVQNNNYIDVSSITLGYNIPTEIARKMKLSRMKVQVSMNNLARISTIETERGTAYPFARTVNFSLNVGF